MDKRFKVLKIGDVITIPMCRDCGLCCIGYGLTKKYREGYIDYAYPCERANKNGCTNKSSVCKGYACESIEMFLWWIDKAITTYFHTNRKYVKRKKLLKLLKEALLRKGKDLKLKECVDIKKLLKEKGVKL